MNHVYHSNSTWRNRIEDFMENPWVQNFLVFLILLNAVILGLETDADIMDKMWPQLHSIDHAILWIFIAELALLITARGWRFFLDAWSLFDFLVVAIALVPATGSLSVLRALRVLRILRLINKVESMRRVVGALLSSLPGLGSVFGLILIIFYVSAVIATNMFGESFPDRFGSLSTSFYTLFQVMTLEGWSEEIARPVMGVFPSSWIFFLVFIFISTFIVVNLFVAVIVDSINSAKEEVDHEQGVTTKHIIESLNGLRSELAELKEQLKNNSERK